MIFVEYSDMLISNRPNSSLHYVVYHKLQDLHTEVYWHKNAVMQHTKNNVNYIQKRIPLPSLLSDMNSEKQ